MGPAPIPADDASDWLGSPPPDDGSLGPQVDAPVEDVALIVGMIGGTPDPQGEEEKDILLGGGMCQYIDIFACPSV